MPDSLDRELDASICPSAPPLFDAVQPHGCLIALDSDWQGVCLASANLSRFFGMSPAAALGQPPEEVLGVDTVTSLAMTLAKGLPGMTILSRQADVSARHLYVSTHVAEAHVILEVEPQEGKGHDLPGLGYAWGMRIARASSVNELYDLLLRALHALTGFESCTLYSHEYGGRSIRLGQEGTLHEPFPSEVSRCVSAPLMLIDSQAEPIELLAMPGPLPDLSRCPLCLPPPLLRTWLTGRQARAALILDLGETTPSRCQVICRDRQPCHLAPPRRQQLLQLVQLAALREALLHEKRETRHRHRLLHERNTRLQWLAYTDPLTQVANRHRIEQVLEAELAIASRNASPLALLLLDVDHFKVINDTHGHEVGDRVLRRVAQETQSRLRDSDHLGRWGGEEFVVIVPGCDLAQAQELACRLCHDFTHCRIEPVGQVTASFGVAVHQPGDTSRKLVQRADHAMYRAKRAGRACVRTQEADE
ncbi:diguanylate cyclase [Billgrantia diversa]|uniref:GGDEF domain-containing protein n=1 Tax=Halomonas sp. MCCC 1A13316 TaxID=2733487 RepID=UPI0018A5A636|nr:GGDEF domain-containing protein [Halomonas sp. MCCC 1A13316]QOR40141.1 diguanylate cyclase [Halomonas sp. MCCC 1A13316]